MTCHLNKSAVRYIQKILISSLLFIKEIEIMSANTQTTTQGAAGSQNAGDGAIVVDNFTKSYGSLRVVDRLSLTVQRGEVFALLGPNGAGKTTTIETLEGYRKPDTGNVRVLGLDPI